MNYVVCEVASKDAVRCEYPYDDMFAYQLKMKRADGTVFIYPVRKTDYSTISVGDVFRFAE